MTRYKAMLLGATALTAMTMGAPAFAFEEVDWTWNNDVNETIDINVTINDTLDPQGLVQVEKLQVHFGDVKANAEVSGIHNTPAIPNSGGVATVDETFVFTGTGDQVPDPTEFPETIGVGDGSSGLTAVLTPPSTYDEGDQGFSFQVNVTGEVDVPPTEGMLDAVDLPKIDNAATAVANNQSITADVPIYLHDGQFAAGGFNTGCGNGEVGVASYGSCPDALGFLIGAYGVTVLDGQLDGINEHTSIAGLMTVAAATGYIQPATVEANASVSDVLNAYVDNSATAVTNNASFTVESTNLDNHIVVADVTQWGYANVSANARVSQVALNDYTGFGEAGLGGGIGDVTPIVSNSATAVGNNLSIKVGVPSVD